MTARRTLYAFLGLLFAAAALFYAHPAGSAPPPTIQSGFSVKVVLPNGHGSGTHIGDGYIVTAAHVVGDKTKVSIKTGHGNPRYADVLWVNKAYDVALLRTNPQGVASAHMSCRTLHAGDTVRADGNPVNLEFVSSSGKISGDIRETAPWKSVYITDMTTVMGMSGGGVFDKFGDMIGVTVGVAAVPLQTGPSTWAPSLTGFGMVVPSSVVCDLMGWGVK